MSPRSYRIIAILVVATTFETEARSKTVATVTAGELRLVSESPNGFQRDQFSLIGNRNRSCRKCRPGNSFLQDAEGAAKDRILPLVCGSREAGRGLCSGTRRGRTLRQRCDVLDIRVITKFRGRVKPPFTRAWGTKPAGANQSGHSATVIPQTAPLHFGFLSNIPPLVNSKHPLNFPNSTSVRASPRRLSCCHLFPLLATAATAKAPGNSKTGSPRFHHPRRHPRPPDARRGASGRARRTSDLPQSLRQSRPRAPPRAHDRRHYFRPRIAHQSDRHHHSRHATGAKG